MGQHAQQLTDDRRLAPGYNPRDDDPADWNLDTYPKHQVSVRPGFVRAIMRSCEEALNRVDNEEIPYEYTDEE